MSEFKVRSISDPLPSKSKGTEPVLNQDIKSFLKENKENYFYSEYKIGDIVYLKTDPDKNARMITRITFDGNKKIYYTLSFSHYESNHYVMEFSYEKEHLNY